MSAVAVMSQPRAMPISNDLDFDLSNLLNSLSLHQKTRERESAASAPTPNPAADDVQMSIEPANSQPATSASSPSSAATPPSCAFLSALTAQYETYADADSDDYATTGGAYLDTILVHREVFAACPGLHAGCPAAFTALAHALEHRAWRADRDADTEAVAAFRQEAWQIAMWMSSGGMWWTPKREE